MFQNFRLAMAWVHTWFGLFLGFVLMMVFFFGSLSVFDREIDRWAIPESRFEPQPMPSFDEILKPVFEDMQPSRESVDQMRSRVDGPMPEHFDTPVRWGFTPRTGTRCWDCSPATRCPTPTTRTSWCGAPAPSIRAPASPCRTIN